MSNYLGCVYVFSNPSMPGLLKVGKADNPEERLKELSSSTGVPEPFEEVAVFPSAHPYRDEREAHEILSEYRNKSNREFFKIDAEKCIDILKTVLGDPIPSSDQPYINIFEAAKSGNSNAVISLINFGNSKNIDVFDSLCSYDLKEKVSFHETKESQGQSSTEAEGSSQVERVRHPNFVYKGEKKDGLRHGQGKLFVDGTLWFEGEFKDGEECGKGKQYNDDGILVYEGEFKDGKYHGQGKYFLEASLWYEGEFKDGKYHGQGKKYNKDGNVFFEGEFKDGKEIGQGKSYYDDGSLEYEGEIKDSKRNGNGQDKQYNEDGVLVYEGEFKDAEYHGQGKYFRDDGSLWYEGEFKDDEWNGQGKDYYEEGTLRYEGEFKEGKRRGQGKYTWSEGLSYVGEFENNTAQGHGKVFYKNGTLKYVGDYFAGERHGQGKLFYDDGSIEYEGEFLKHEFHGQGKYFVEDKLKYEGIFKDGKFLEAAKVYIEESPNSEGDETKRKNEDSNYENSFKKFVVIPKEQEYEIVREKKHRGTKLYDLKFLDGSLFDGEIYKDKMHGVGRYRWASNGKRNEPGHPHSHQYSGDWKKGKQHGEGYMYYFPDGEYFEGEYKNGSPYNGILWSDIKMGTKLCEYKEGKKINLSNEIIEEFEVNLSFEGEWKKREEFKKEDESISYQAKLKDGKYNSVGKVFENKILLYEGELKDGIFEGNGKAFFKSGIIGYEGQWKNGKWDGFGKLYNSFGDIVYEGKWEDGEKID